MASLSEKLKALGVKLGTEELPPPRPRRERYAVEQILPGRFQETTQGQVFLVEQQYPAAYRHGRTGLEIPTPLPAIARWAGEQRLAGSSLASFAFLDTETTGLAGGAGTYAFLIGVGRYRDGQFHLAQFFMRAPQEEPAQLAALAEFLEPCQVLVTFNGKAFDLPLLTSRFLMNRQPPDLAGLAQLDLLPLARRLWSNRLPSRALGYLEQHILGARRGQEDVPGWLIPSLYFNYLHSGDARPLKSVFYHNTMDVLAMAALLNHMAGMIEDPLNGTVEHGLEWIALGKLFEGLGEMELAAQLYRQGLARELPAESRSQSMQQLARMERRRGQWTAALALWQQAAAEGQLEAHVELAKFYEHQARDYPQALSWTQAALARLNTPPYPPAERARQRPELEHRLARLRRKLKK